MLFLQANSLPTTMHRYIELVEEYLAKMDRVTESKLRAEVLRQEISEIKRQLKSRSIRPLQRSELMFDKHMKELLLAAYGPREKAEDLYKASVQSLSDSLKVGPERHFVEIAKCVAFYKDSMQAYEKHEWRMIGFTSMVLRQQWPQAPWPHRPELFRKAMAPVPSSMLRVARFRWKRISFPWVLRGLHFVLTRRMIGR